MSASLEEKGEGQARRRLAWAAVALGKTLDVWWPFGGGVVLSAVTLHFENIQSRIVRARELSETRDLLTELLAMSDYRLFTLFGVTRYSPQDVHSLRDRIFSGLVAELNRNGWNCNSASFGVGHRDTLLMEMARRGLSLTVTRLLEMGADADYNT